MRFLLKISLLVIFLIQGTAYAQVSWSQWLADFKQEAVEDGIDPQFFDETFMGLTMNRRVLHFDRRQPERRLTFYKYRKTRADKFRIQLGRREFKRHQTLLTQVGERYGVDPCFITSLWGMESSYGRFMGSFSVIKSLATLAFDDRRSAFFRKELLLALHILQEGHVEPEQFKGEWAGGSGHPQFLPSSWHRFAVDYNGDGKKDIWATKSDVFASIANYLASNGWRYGEPWAVEVSVPPHFDDTLKGYKTHRLVSEWQDMGVRATDGKALPDPSLSASIIQPYGGPYLLIFKNFRVLLRYNNSSFYAGSVGYMADQICSRDR